MYAQHGLGQVFNGENGEGWGAEAGVKGLEAAEASYVPMTIPDPELPPFVPWFPEPEERLPEGPRPILEPFIPELILSPPPLPVPLLPPPPPTPLPPEPPPTPDPPVTSVPEPLAIPAGPGAILTTCAPGWTMVNGRCEPMAVPAGPGAVLTTCAPGWTMVNGRCEPMALPPEPIGLPPPGPPEPTPTTEPPTPITEPPTFDPAVASDLPEGVGEVVTIQVQLRNAGAFGGGNTGLRFSMPGLNGTVCARGAALTQLPPGSATNTDTLGEWTLTGQWTPPGASGGCTFIASAARQISEPSPTVLAELPEQPTPFQDVPLGETVTLEPLEPFTPDGVPILPNGAPPPPPGGFVPIPTGPGVAPAPIGPGAEAPLIPVDPGAAADGRGFGFVPFLIAAGLAWFLSQSYRDG